MKQRLFLFTAILLALISCSGDNDPDNEKNGGGPSNKDYLTVKVNIPATTELSTYALTSYHESVIKEIDVLLFNKADDKFISRQEGTGIKDAADAENGNKKEFHIQIPQDGTYSSIYLMVLANARQDIQEAIDRGDIATTKSKDEIMRSLTCLNGKFDRSFWGDERWPVMPGPFIPFPMFGISPDIDLTQAAITVNPVTLVRSVAKIDVGVNFDSSNKPLGIQNPTLNNTFKIESVTLCNTNSAFMIAPDPDNWTGTRVTAPSLLPHHGSRSSEITYARLRGDDSNKFGFLNTIYTVEVDNINDVAHHNTNPYLVIGGYFTEKGKPENTTTLTYYRIDFLKSIKDVNGTVIRQDPLPILRNYRYRVNIIKVSQEGYATIAGAASSRGNNNSMIADITDEDDVIHDLVYDGDYMMGIETDSVFFDKAAIANNEVWVSTTHPQGWKATVIEGGSWLTLTNAQQAAGGKSQLKFNVASNTGGRDRDGIITIRSGRMTMNIKVKQSSYNYIAADYMQPFYPMDGENYHFFVAAVFDYRVRVEDPYNVVEFITSDGRGNKTWTGFHLVLRNDMVNQLIKQAHIKIVFYSPDNKFPDYTVPITCKTPFDIGGNVYVYPEDQPQATGSTAYSWYVYSNTPDGINENSVPPTTGTQADPKRKNSCASLDGSRTKPWRLPTVGELSSIHSFLKTDDSNFAKYNFKGNGTSSSYYTSSTTYSGGAYSGVNIVNVKSNPSILIQSTDKNITHVALNARCVRSK